MEKDYKKYLAREEAIKKKKLEEKNIKQQFLNDETQKIQDSVSIAQIQATQDLSDDEQRPGESKGDYYRRQKISRLKTGFSDKIKKHPQIEKTGKFIKQKAGNAIKKSPKLTQAYNDIKTFRSKREQEIEKLKERANEEAKARVKQRLAQSARRAAQATARAASQLTKIAIQGLRQAIIWLGGAALGTIGGTGCIAIIIIFIAVIALTVVQQACDNSALSGLSAGMGPLGILSRIWGCGGF